MYYKVVKRNDHGELVSAIVHPAYVDFYRVYQKNDKNLTVNNGMAFDNIEDAKNFARYNDEIWACTGQQINLPRFNFTLDIDNGYDVFLMAPIIRGVLFHGMKYGGYNNQFPSHTVRLRDLKLKERII